MIRRRPRIAEVVVDAPPRTVVAAVPDGRPLVLEGSAETIWARIPAAGAAPLALDALVDAVAEAAGVDPAVVDGDVRAFVAELRAEGLVESADA